MKPSNLQEFTTCIYRKKTKYRNCRALVFLLISNNLLDFFVYTKLYCIHYAVNINV